MKTFSSRSSYVVHDERRKMAIARLTLWLSLKYHLTRRVSTVVKRGGGV